MVADAPSKVETKKRWEMEEDVTGLKDSALPCLDGDGLKHKTRRQTLPWD